MITVPLSMTCPYCGMESTKSTNLTHDTLPREGDFAVCIQCAGVLVFDGAVGLKKAEVSHIVDVMRSDPKTVDDLAAAVAHVSRIAKRRTQ